MPYPTNHFDERTIIRWSKDFMLGHQPMMDEAYVYRDQEFHSKGGYWYFNGEQFGALADVKMAIDIYDDEIERLLELVADS